MKDTHTLIAGVLDSDAAPSSRHQAFGEIVARFQNMAFACAYAILNDFYLAEDVAQEAFITAWQRLDQLEDPRAFPGWFKRVVLTECNRLTRGKRLRVAPLEAGLDVASTNPDPESVAEKRELAELLLAAIRALPEHERMVTTLFYIDEYSQNEISDFLELQVTTVAKRLFSARRRMKEGLVEMLKKNLKEHRPSRHTAFAEQVRARLRPFAAEDWEVVTSIAYSLDAAFRADDEIWMRNRRRFDESRYVRRHYVGEHAETGQVLGYGSIEQTIFLPNYRLFLVAPPGWLENGVGDLLLDRLMKDLRKVKAVAVFHRNYAQLTDTSDFLKARGFEETSRVWDLRLAVADADLDIARSIAERLRARGIIITTLARERETNPESLSRIHELLNLVMADEPGRADFAPVPVDTVARWLSRRGFLADACFIAKDSGRYIGITDLHLIDDLACGVTSGFTGVAREYRRQGLATALKMRAVEYAREHGFQLIRAFNHHANLPMLAVNERLGFSRRFSYVTLEKWLKKVKKVNPAVYDVYVGQYRIDPAHLEKRKLPPGLTVTVKRIGDRLLSEIRDMQDELFPESKTRFFTRMHYGEVEFVVDEQGRATRLVYREPEEEFHADKIS